MSYAVLFAGNPKPQYYHASSAMNAIVTAMHLDSKVYGRVIGIALNVSPYRSV